MTNKLLKKHPISILDVMVNELFIKCIVLPSDVSEDIDITYSIRVGHSDYNTEDNTIVVGLQLEVNEDEEIEYTPPYQLRVDLRARFKVDEASFPVEQIEHWAQKNAPMILHPYVREHAYSLTLRAGYIPLNIELLQVPTFEIKKEE